MARKAVFPMQFLREYLYWKTTKIHSTHKTWGKAQLFFNKRRSTPHMPLGTSIALILSFQKGSWAQPDDAWKQVKGLGLNRLRHLITFIQNFLIRPGQPFLPPYRPNAGILDMEMLHMGFRAWPWIFNYEQKSLERHVRTTHRSMLNPPTLAQDLYGLGMKHHQCISKVPH